MPHIITVLPIKGVLKDDSVIISVNDLPKTINNSKLSYSSLSDNDLVDTFKFKVNDGISSSNEATVSINISPVNDKPTAFHISKMFRIVKVKSSHIKTVGFC